jgi:hypothetical protein
VDSSFHFSVASKRNQETYSLLAFTIRPMELNMHTLSGLLANQVRRADAKNGCCRDGRRIVWRL